MSHSTLGQFPRIRLRRARRTAGLRRLVAETNLSTDNLIYPVFVLEGEGRIEPIKSILVFEFLLLLQTAASRDPM